MAKGSFSGTASSAVLVAADYNRDCLIIQHTNATVAALGIGEAAEAGKGIQLLKVGDVVKLTGHNARQAIYVIGNGATGTYQDGTGIDVFPGSAAT
jgi:hypothetical protein